MKRYNNLGNKIHFVFFFLILPSIELHIIVRKLQNTNTYIYRLLKFLTIKAKLCYCSSVIVFVWNWKANSSIFISICQWIYIFFYIYNWFVISQVQFFSFEGNAVRDVVPVYWYYKCKKFHESRHFNKGGVGYQNHLF
jgi:hypothetical protein